MPELNNIQFAYTCPECSAELTSIESTYNTTVYQTLSLQEPELHGPPNQRRIYINEYCDYSEEGESINTTYACPECDAEINELQSLIPEETRELILQNVERTNTPNYNQQQENKVIKEKVCKNCKNLNIVDLNNKNELCSYCSELINNEELN
jgi:DNA-directed RNA polymerase subunit RPC12/RpoP